MRRRWYANAREIVAGGDVDGATVVLAHGYGVNQESCWGKILPSIVSQANKVLLFDWDFTAQQEEEDEDSYYTFGRFADDLIELMDEKKVRGAVLVAHSMSAMVACIASKRRPELFAHLVILCASPRYINSSSWEEDGEEYVGGFEESAIHGMLAAMENDFPGWVHGFIPNAARDEACVETLEGSFLAMDPAVAVRVARMIFLGDQRDALDSVPVACTLVQARHDFAAPVVVAEYMRRRMSNNNKAGMTVELEVVESAGHFPQLVAPKRVLEIVHSVLRRTSNVGPAAAEVPVVDRGINVGTPT